MINANEIRRGNKLIMNGKVHTVVEIEEHHTKCSYFDGVTIVPRYAVIENEKLQPIELTKEILLECGFERSGLYVVKDQVYLYDTFVEDCNFVYKYNYAKSKIKHLHQIQNLYLSLTGQELTTNL